MPYKPNPEARGVSHKTDREGWAKNTGISVARVNAACLAISEP